MKQFLLAVAIAIVGFAGTASAQVVFDTSTGSNIVVDRAGNPTYVFARVHNNTTRNDITSMWTGSAPANCTASAPTIVDLGNGKIGIVTITCNASATPGYYSFNASALGLDYSTAPPTQVSGGQSWYVQVTN